MQLGEPLSLPDCGLWGALIAGLVNAVLERAGGAKIADVGARVTS